MIKFLIVFFLSVSVYAENALKDAVSPYLRQHAENPIHWVEWSDEALVTAKKNNTLIFLSIGYSSCHWCHVMEKETFADQSVANLLNESFINIKVDKETRPDIDHRYMTALKLMKGEGGWPVTAFLTPNGDVVFIDSYLAQEKFVKLATRLNHIWQKSPQALRANAKRLTAQVDAYLAPTKLQKVYLSEEALTKAAKNIVASLDLNTAGLKGAPKFPNEMVYLFLLDYSQHTHDRKMQAQVLSALRFMARSAIFDAIDGGFHRYAVDGYWKEPHFEKMLYTQGLLLSLYSRAYQISPEPLFKTVAQKTISFLRKTMSDGALFFSSIDADNEGVEGGFYQFSPAEFLEVFPPTYHPIVRQVFHVTKYVPVSFTLNQPSDQSLSDFQLSRKDWVSINQNAKQQLADRRAKRPTPFVDRKKITAWNAMAIKGLVDLARAFDDKAYLNMAIDHMHQLLTGNRLSKRLIRYSYSGKAQKAEATLDDFSWLLTALIALYDATGEDRWLLEAESLFLEMQNNFYDKRTESFQLYQVKNQGAISQQVFDLEDNNYPSPSSMALLSAQQLYQRTGRIQYKSFSGIPLTEKTINLNPPIYATLLQAQLGHTLMQERYFANGKGKLSLNKYNSIDISLEAGWHINSHNPGVESLIPTRIQIDGEEIKHYPNAKRLETAFSAAEINVWEGEISIPVDLNKSANVDIQLQACSQDRCLAPERLRL